METGEEPMIVNWEQETLPEHVTDVVATPDTPAPPFEVRICPPVRFVVVASPQYVTVEFVPPTKAPSVPETEKGPETEYEEVATLPRRAG
jgi:hypothetical protein